MNSLTRWNPWREMMSLRRDMDRLFEASGDSGLMPWQNEDRSMALDVIENDDEFVVKASLPGIDPDDIDVTLTNNVLTIKGEIQRDETSEEGQYHLRERAYGSFSRSLTLSTRVNADEVSANYENGILTLTIPKAEEVKPKRIQIKAGSPTMIEGETVS